MDSGARLRALRRWQRLLDSAFRVPGTGIRFGWDPLVGLIPGVGDVATAAMAVALVVEAHRLRLPRVVQLRMLFNIGIDVLVGLVPLIGDVADVFWKANAKNLDLLERHARSRPATAGDRAFVVVLVLAVVAVVALPLLMMLWLLTLIGRPFV
jgi:uncharacterized protein DUF4112